jgi:DNA-binding transcriptional MerR regulator/methanogenic corrinoid protein MtbC1
VSDGPQQELLRIGELSRRVGVAPELLRAWERRYELLAPVRTAGGFRLYGESDERRVRRMCEHLANGVAAAEAARLARSEVQQTGPVSEATAVVEALPGGQSEVGDGEIAVDALRELLSGALDRFDDVAAHAVLDRLFGAYSLDVVLGDAVLPYLRDLGERWAAGEASVAQEHFASSLLRGRLLALARGWGRGVGPRALLACLPGDLHDLGLVCFGLALRGHGWRITFLGPDTPLSTLASVTELLDPSLVVLTAALTEHAARVRAGLGELAQITPLALAGAGVTAALAGSVGARRLAEGPVEAAASIADARRDVAISS